MTYVWPELCSDHLLGWYYMVCEVFFGSNSEEQSACRLLELDAYYALVKINSIEDTVNMCPVFERNSSTFSRRTWLETVCLR